MLAKFAIAILSLGICGANAATAPRAECKTLAEIAVSTPGFETLVAAVKAAGLADALADPNGPKYTVFAPLDTAFDDVDKKELAKLLEPANKDDLVKLLQYHLVKGVLNTDDLKNGQQLTTVEGGKLKVEVEIDDGKREVSIEDANGDSADIVKANIPACNGVVNVIDEVLIPKGLKALDD